MRPASAKAKGRRLQYRVRDDLQQALRLLPGDILSRSMGAAGTDLVLSPAAQARFPFAVECKNQETVALWAAFRQAEANAGTQPPLLVVARNRTPPLAVLRWSDLLALLAAPARTEG